ncbi:conserved hypothetical protein [Ricinus communis]|uniref:Uncharacterized protein n=1 Tax=Ricinus communis TaxID=3988 RepID=B9S016_RICCO|nr:conserved hypothetical protein [Ricinus communis]
MGIGEERMVFGLAAQSENSLLNGTEEEKGKGYDMGHILIEKCYASLSPYPTDVVVH